jgi:hypothetical protein
LFSVDLHIVAIAEKKLSHRLKCLSRISRHIHFLSRLVAVRRPGSSMNSSLSRRVIFYFDPRRLAIAIIWASSKILRCFRSESPGSRETPFLGRAKRSLKELSRIVHQVVLGHAWQCRRAWDVAFDR